MANRPITSVQVTDKNDVVDVNIEETPKVEPTPADPVPNPPAVIVEEKAESRDGADAIPTPDNPLVLKNPILINGVSVDELPWTIDITAKQFLDADMRAHQKRPIITLTETDNGFQFELGVAMICAADQRIDPRDLDQVKGRDVMRVMRLGRFFTSDSDD